MINDHNVSFLDAVTTVDVFTLHMRYKRFETRTLHLHD